MPECVGLFTNNSVQMPFIDMAAKRHLINLRENRGLSPEALADEITQSALRDNQPRGTIDAYTIRRAERGLVPSIRTRFVLARHFKVQPGEIWDQDAWVKIDSSRPSMRVSA